MEPGRDKLLWMFRSLLLLRRMEERTVELTLSGQVPGWLHSYLGQEAVGVGVCAQLRPDDLVASTHRGRGHFLAKGLDPRLLMAEVLGRRDGVCGGKGGEMHLSCWEKGIIGSSGIVGGILSLATGVAFACQYQGTGQVVVAFFGDGATNQGTFHECLNLSSIWNLPIVYVCENNGVALSTPQGKAMRVPDIARRALAYNIPGETVDGDDVLTVYRGAGEAIARARQGEGPTLLECRTHRWLGHFVGDPQKYLPEEELAQLRSHDPIPPLESYLLEHRVLFPQEMEAVKAEVEREVAEAVEFALSSPFPDPAQALTDVFAPEEP